MRDGKHVILCIDDDQDILDALRPVLEGNGYEMVEAATAEEGLKVYQETNPDLIIVDLMMEEIDAGASFVKELKALGSSVPVYVLSSVGDGLNAMTDYAGLGLTGVFQKPIDPARLLATLKAKLG